MIAMFIVPRTARRSDNVVFSKRKGGKRSVTLVFVCGKGQPAKGHISLLIMASGRRLYGNCKHHWFDRFGYRVGGPIA